MLLGLLLVVLVVVVMTPLWWREESLMDVHRFLFIFTTSTVLFFLYSIQYYQYLPEVVIIINVRR
jgi:hypothetical protein